MRRRRRAARPRTELVLLLHRGAEGLDERAFGAGVDLLHRDGGGRVAGLVGELVVGLPLNMDGTEGPRAKLARSVHRR